MKSVIILILSPGLLTGSLLVDLLYHMCVGVELSVLSIAGRQSVVFYGPSVA